MRDIIYKLARVLTPRERVQAVLLLVGMIVAAVLEMVGVGAIPAFVATLTDPEILRSNALGARVFAVLGATSDEELIRTSAMLLLFVFLVKNLYLGVLLWVASRYLFNRQVALAGRLFEVYLSRPYTFHLQRNSAQLLRNTNHDAMNVVSLGLTPLMIGTAEVLSLGAILALLLAIEPLTSLAAFLILGGSAAVFLRVVRRRMTSLGEQERQQREGMLRAVTEGLGGIKITRTLGRERHFLDRFRAASAGFAEAGRARQVLAEVPRLVLETIAIAGLLGAAALLLARGRSVEALVPTLTLLAVAVVRMIPSFGRLTTAMNSLRFGRAALTGVYDDLVGLDVLPASDSTLPDLRDAIRLEGVHYTYPDAPGPSLEEVSLEIGRGKAVGLVGPSGAGKTTVVDLILGLLEPTQGRVTIDGVDLRGHERGWQRHIGYIPQDVYLSDASIRSNIAFGIADGAIDDVAVARAVEAAQVGEFVARLPSGIHTAVGERGVRLSGGQRQRIGIARALYHDPDVLLMDEATSALDSETEQYVMRAIEHLRGSRTLVIIAHRLSTVAACDRLVLLREGRVVASGTYDELEGASEEFRKLAAGG